MRLSVCVCVTWCEFESAADQTRPADTNSSSMPTEDDMSYSKLNMEIKITLYLIGKKITTIIN